MADTLLLDPFANIINVRWPKKGGIPGPGTVYVGAWVEIIWALGQSTAGWRGDQVTDGLGNIVHGTFAGSDGTNYAGEPSARTGAMSIVLITAATDHASWTVSDSEGLSWDYAANWDANFVAESGAIYKPTGTTTPFYDDSAGMSVPRALRWRWRIILTKTN